MDREELIALVDQKVAVRLKNVEAGGVGIIATLDGVRADGIMLREAEDRRSRTDGLLLVGGPAPGPAATLGLHPPQEESVLEERVPEGPWPGESYYLRAPGPPERRRQSSARTLERVVPVAQKRTVGDVTAAISSLEIHGQGVGVLRWRISIGEDALNVGPDFWFGTPEPEFEILADGDRSLKWSPMGGGMSDGDSDGDSDGEAEVWELLDTGKLRATVTRLSADAYEPEGDHLEEITLRRAPPWTVPGASGSPSDRVRPR